jgi:hypothetical protein
MDLGSVGVKLALRMTGGRPGRINSGGRERCGLGHDPAGGACAGIPVTSPDVMA